MGCKDSERSRLGMSEAEHLAEAVCPTPAFCQPLWFSNASSTGASAFMVLRFCSPVQIQGLTLVKGLVQGFRA